MKIVLYKELQSLFQKRFSGFQDVEVLHDVEDLTIIVRTIEDAIIYQVNATSFEKQFKINTSKRMDEALKGYEWLFGEYISTCNGWQLVLLNAFITGKIKVFKIN
jgi:hypothetical protein